jgi:hypothetical protein
MSSLPSHMPSLWFVLRLPGLVLYADFSLMSNLLAGPRVVVQVLDGLVLVLAMILNPRAKRVAQHREQNSRDGVRDVAIGGSTKMAAIPASGVQDHK